MTAPYCDPLRLLDNGWHVFPLRRGSKEPAVAGWNRLALSPAPEMQIARWEASFPNTGWGIVCGGCAAAVDNDNDAPEPARLFEAVRLATLGFTPAVRIGKPGRSVTLYRPTDPIHYTAMPATGGEIYGLNSDGVTGRQVAAYGPHPKAAAGRYTWPVEDLQALRPSDIPAVSAADMAGFVAALAMAFVSTGLARPEALREGRPGALDRNAARIVREAGKGGGAEAALQAARRVLEAAAATQRGGRACLRHPLGLAVMVETANAGCDPDDVAWTLREDWGALFGRREHGKRGGELAGLASWIKARTA